MDNIFDQIKQKLKLLSYAQKFIKLKIVGNRYLGLCPFHHEKTPSFYVDDVQNLFYCFGCNNGGDIFSFYCLINNCDKKEALSSLAKIAGVNYSNIIIKNDLDIMLQFFMDQKQHINFLKNRGITDEFIIKFQLGWSCDYFSMEKYIKNQQISLENLGFKDSFLKSFQNRIVFPIFNEIGTLVSFSGRSLKDGPFKYINGADSNIFHKFEILYGLNFISNKEEIFLVEGHIDVVMMQQFGYSCVASMGTAVSNEHIKILWRHTNKIIVMMDGDSAGQKSSYKIALLALELIKVGKEIYFIILDEQNDPASYLNIYSSIDNLRRYPLCEFLFKMKGEIPTLPDQRAVYFLYIKESLNLIKDPILKAEYMKYFNSIRFENFTRKNKILKEKLSQLGKDYLLLLLFKYIACYHYILDHVGEDFLKLNMNEHYKKNLIGLLNGSSLDVDLIKKLDQINIDIEIFNNDVIDEWYQIYYHIQEFANEKEIKNNFLNDFCEDSWENYKKLIEKKEQNYNE